MTKKQFVDIMHKIKDQYDKNDKWFDEAEKFIYGSTISLIEHDYLDILLETVQISMGDTEEWVNHYMYADYSKPDWFKVTINNNEIKVDSFEKLYDLIKCEGVFAR